MAKDVVVKKVNLFSLLSKEGLVVYSEGSIDFAATLEGIQNQVQAESDAAAIWDQQITVALNEVFDSLAAGSRIPEPMAVNLVERKLYQGSSIAEMTVVRGKIQDYLDRSTEFTGKRGRGGGLGRE